MAKGVKTGGRKKGTPNKLQRDVKESILDVFDMLGGVDAFHNWAVREKTEFYKLYGKLLPKDLNAKVEGALSVEVLTGVTK